MGETNLLFDDEIDFAYLVLGVRRIGPCRGCSYARNASKASNSRYITLPLRSIEVVPVSLYVIIGAVGERSSPLIYKGRIV